MQLFAKHAPKSNQDNKIPMKEKFWSAKDLLEVQKNSAIHAENYEKDKKFESRRVGAS